MHPVLCLIEDGRLLRIDHRICHFFAAACRKAVQEQGMSCGLGHQSFINLIISEMPGRFFRPFSWANLTPVLVFTGFSPLTPSLGLTKQLIIAPFLAPNFRCVATN